MSASYGECADCGAALGRGNKTGYCRRHVSRAIARDPAWQEKQRQGLLRKLRSDPVYLDRKRADMRKANASRDFGQLRERMLTNRYWEKSNASRPAGHPSRVQAGRTITARALGDIPPYLREEYLRLNRRKHIPAAEARRIILEQHSNNLSTKLGNVVAAGPAGADDEQ